MSNWGPDIAIFQGARRRSLYTARMIWATKLGKFTTDAHNDTLFNNRINQMFPVLNQTCSIYNYMRRKVSQYSDKRKNLAQGLQSRETTATYYCSRQALTAKMAKAHGWRGGSNKNTNPESIIADLRLRKHRGLPYCKRQCLCRPVGFCPTLCVTGLCLGQKSYGFLYRN